MNKEEIKEYLKRVEELELKLIGEDRETLQWLIYGYNECARLLNQLETNWNELKGWLRANDIHYAEAIPFRETLRKMQELEGGSNE